MPTQEITRTGLGDMIASNYGIYYNLHLFIAINDPASEEAQANLSQICETHMTGRYELQVTDINKDFATVIKNGVLVTPTLKVIITSKGDPPLKPVTIIGTLGDTQRVLAALLIKA